MTNREWLNSLSNEDLANWLCDALPDEKLAMEYRLPVFIGLSQLKFAYTDSRLGLKHWLGEEHNE